MALAVGATLVSADIDPLTWCLQPESVAKVITHRTKAIIAVHLYGNVADMNPLIGLADGCGAVVIEDAAQACASKYKGRIAGTIGDVGTLSFHAAKLITTGEGGAVLTAKGAIKEQVAIRRDHGMNIDRRYWHDVVGHNFRLTNLQAAMGCAQLKSIDNFISSRVRVHTKYRNLLGALAGFREQYVHDFIDAVPVAFAGQLLKKDTESIEQLRLRRDTVIQLMRDRGIELRPGFYALSSLPLYNCPDLEGSSLAAASVVLLPCYPSLEDVAIERTCREFIKAVGEA